jgi:hypothetical protein
MSVFWGEATSGGHSDMSAYDPSLPWEGKVCCYAKTALQSFS